MKRCLYLFIFFLSAIQWESVSAQNSGQLIPYASGLVKPIGIVHAGDSRLFIVDQRGFIQIVNSLGVVNPVPFLNFSNRVVVGNEQGLLGLAFHPNYKVNGFFYINYIGPGDSTHISRLRVSASDPNVADPQSEVRLLTVFQPYKNHNGGDLKFGPDGYLYIGLGDGGSGGDPGNRSQNPKELLGKMLRIDVDKGNPYSIPTTNPFSGSTSIKPEIWALGLRNPWRFSFDRITGDLWIADVGQDAIEEVNFQPVTSKGGENYGWRCYEGNQTFNTTGCTQSANLTFPVYAYPQDLECSVTGGFVYRGSQASPYYGKYFFADYCSDRIWTLKKTGDNWVKEDFGQFSGNNFSTFGEDVNGQLYIAGIKSGKIFRIADKVTEAGSADLPNFKVTQIASGKLLRIETGQVPEITQLAVYDLTGAERSKTFHQGSIFELDLNFLKSGIYFLKIFSDHKIQVKKIFLP